MRTTPTDLNPFLDALAKDAQPGDRLPPVRELMRRFGASQAVVQQAFDRLKAQGLIESQVGRGTFFQAAGSSRTASAPPPATALRSVLLLRRSVSIVRGRVVVDGLQRRFAAAGHRVLEVSYSDPEHARSVLKGLPRFDACMIQSTFETITLETLAAVRQKTETIVVDGAALFGTDVDAVGLEWGEPLARAVHRLVQQGHRSIAHATTSRPFLANELGRRRFDELRGALGAVTLQSLIVPRLPQDDLEAALVTQLKQQLDASGRLPFTALVAWGIEDGARFCALLAQAGVTLPSTLSVILLGRADLPNEHAGFFEVVGCNVSDQIDYLHEAIVARWADPARPYGIRFLPVVTRAGASVQAANVVSPRAPRRRGEA